MTRRLNPSWCEKMLEQINTGQEVVYISLHRITAQFLVEWLTKTNRPYRIINLGAGVNKITTKDLDVCPKCHGTGKV